MRTCRIVVVLLTLLSGGLLLPPTASAGGWAETVLDPPPAQIEAKTTYTFGYWVLQHGSYPYRHGDLGPTGLMATDENGEQVIFPGTPSTTLGHYSAEVVFPHNGTWQLGGHHQVLAQDEEVATVIVPGPVKILMSQVEARAPYEWDAVRPSFPPTDPTAKIAAPGGVAQESATEPTSRPVRRQAAVDEPGTTLPMGLVIAGGVATIGLAMWLARRAMRRNRTERSLRSE